MGYQRDEKRISLFGKKLREIRVSKNITQEKLSAITDLEISQISRIERGIINTSISHLFILADALEISPSDLLNFNDIET